MAEVEVSSDDEMDEETAVAGQDDEEEGEKGERSAQSIRNARKKARNSGYRKLAYSTGAGVGKANSFKNMTKYAISASDLARLAQWAPETGEGVESEESLRARLALHFASLPSGAAAVLHANVEAFARNIMADAVDRVRDGASNTLTAAHLRSALRKVNSALEFNFELPAGVVEHARTAEKGSYTGTGSNRQWVSSGTVLPEYTEDQQLKVEENKSNIKMLNKIIKQKDRAHQLKKEERKLRSAAGQGSAAVEANA